MKQAHAYCYDSEIVIYIVIKKGCVDVLLYLCRPWSNLKNIANRIRRHDITVRWQFICELCLQELTVSYSAKAVYGLFI